MENTQPSKAQNGFLKRNWWKLTILLVLLYLVFQKDLSFQVNLSNPYAPDSVPETAEQPDKMTDQIQAAPVSTSNPSLRDLFELPSIFGGKKENTPLYSQLRPVGEDEKLNYLKRFARVAISERKKFSIPSSIILGSALLQSTAGTRSMTVTGNNHFGIKCGDQWSGQSGLYQGQCFRHYENAWASFRDNSDRIAQNHPDLLNLEPTDYKGWAKNLEKEGYSTESGFARQLIELIETYQLFELDQK